MRRILKPVLRGRPKEDDRPDEWAHLLEGALETANISRWILQHGQASVPTALNASLRKHAFEVSVVDQFHTLAQRWFERAGVAAMWERPFPTGKRGKPLAVDISLFNPSQKTETRIEFGDFSPAKLRDDALKLAELKTDTLPDYKRVENFVILWKEFQDKPNDMDNLRAMGRTFTDAASKVDGAKVIHRWTTCIDLFSVEERKAHVAYIGVHEVLDAKLPAPSS